MNAKNKILNVPITKILIGIIACGTVVALGQAGMESLLNLTPLSSEYKGLLKGLVIAILSISTYVFLFKWYEKRSIFELSTQKLTSNLTLGIVLGATLQCLTIFVIYLSGGFTVTSFNGFSFIIPSITMAFTSAIFEEILFRGILFRIVEEKLGSYFALGISSFVFGAGHLANPTSSWTAGLAIAIQAGLLLGVAFIYSRNLWLSIALHFAWNFTQSGIFGAATSGNDSSGSLLTTQLYGDELTTGGAFGPEASVQATVFCVLVAIGILIKCVNENKIIKPFWVQAAAKNQSA